jgi:thiol-disulfide isomerase/thioredoxin
MRLLTMSALISTAVLFTATIARAVTVGDPAPALAVGEWVQGEPVKGIEPGKVHVVEFWATWCGPCVAAIPHINDLSKKYPDVIFIGQNVWERDESKVKPFIARMGDKMTYRVAMDDKRTDPDGAMASTWMRAAGQNGIPATFIINQEGKIAWIGHPMTMDEPLAQIVAGKFDLEASKKASNAAKYEMERQMKLQQAMTQTVGPAAMKKDYAGISSGIDQLVADFPEQKSTLHFARVMILCESGGYAQANDAARGLADTLAGDPQRLNAVAWKLVDEMPADKRDLDLCLKLATAANNAADGKDPATLDTLARVHFDRGDKALAIDTQKKAVDIATGDLKTELTATLKRYEAAR